MKILIHKKCSIDDDLIVKSNLIKYQKSLSVKPLDSYNLFLVSVPFIHYLIQRFSTKIIKTTPRIDKALTYDFLPSAQFILAFEKNGILLMSLKTAPNSLNEIWLNGINILIPLQSISRVKVHHHKIVIYNNLFSNKSLHKLTIKAIKMHHLEYTKADRHHLRDEIRQYHPVNKNFDKNFSVNNILNHKESTQSTLKSIRQKNHISAQYDILSAHYSLYDASSYVSPKQNFGHTSSNTKGVSVQDSKLAQCLLFMTPKNLFIYNNKHRKLAISLSKIKTFDMSNNRAKKVPIDLCLYPKGESRALFIRIDNDDASILPDNIQDKSRSNIMRDLNFNKIHSIKKYQVWQKCFKNIKRWNKQTK